MKAEIETFHKNELNLLRSFTVTCPQNRTVTKHTVVDNETNYFVVNLENGDIVKVTYIVSLHGRPQRFTVNLVAHDKANPIIIKVRGVEKGYIRGQFLIEGDCPPVFWIENSKPILNKRRIL